MKLHPFRQFLHFLYSIYFYATFFVWSNIFFCYGQLRGFKTHNEWRLLGLHALDVIFLLTHIRVDVTGRENIPDEPVIFCANHQSFLDGLIVFYIIRRPFTAITAPYAIFPGNLKRWFEKMGYISIGRDLFEELHYKGTLEHSKSVSEGVAILKKGESLLIFPEGKREYRHHLLPFHGGVVKIASEAKVPVVPMTITGLDTLFPFGSFLLTPIRLGAVIENPVRLHEVANDTLHDTKKLEEIIAQHLPQSYTASESVPEHPHGKRAAFFDLDGTLTRRDIYPYIIMRYFRQHVSFRSFLLLCHLITKRLTHKHGRFYHDAIRLLQGISVAHMMQGVPELFETERTKLFFPEMLSLLELHRKEGNLVFVLSEEPQEFLDPVLHFLNVPGYGTPTGVHQGRFSGVVSGHIMKDEEKRDRVLELARKYHIDLSKSFAYGNSGHDYPMLRTVGHPALVNPSKKLKRRGKFLGFKIIKQK